MVSVKLLVFKGGLVINIWLVNHYAMPPQYEVRVRNNVMAKYLQKSGHNVTIFAASTIHNTNINLIKDKKKLFIRRSYSGLDFVHIKASSYTGNGFLRIINTIQFPFNFYRVAKKNDEKPDIIICDLGAIFASIPYWISIYCKSKFILEVRDLWPESIVEYMNLSRKNPAVWIMYKLEKWIYKKADNLIFTMEGGKDYIVDKGWDKEIDMSKIHHITNGVDLEEFYSNKEKYKVNDKDLEDSEAFKVIYTGSIRLANNIKKIVDAAQIIKAKRYSDIKFLIYGDGPDRLGLEKYCKSNNIDNVNFKGQVDKKYIPFVLSQGNLNILNYKQTNCWKYGGSQNKLAEYIASGKPVLSTIDMDYNLIDRYGFGISIEDATPEQLAEQIVSFRNMPKKEYDIYCNNALKATKEIDYRILTQKLEEVLLKD